MRVAIDVIDTTSEADVPSFLAANEPSGVEVVFRVFDDPDSAWQLCEQLESFGCDARVRKVRTDTAWTGMSWPARQVARE